MPRCANADHRMSCRAPPLSAVSACRIALRMSSMLGSGGDRRMPIVISASAASEPGLVAAERSTSAWRRSHSVWTQISPSEWTSGPAATLAEVAERVAARPGGDAAGAGGLGSAEPPPTGQSIASERVAWRDGVGGLAEVDLAGEVGRVGLEPLADQQVLGVPVAPRLAHRAGVRVVERADAVLVDDEAVGEAVRVLVPDRRRVVAVVVEERRASSTRTGRAASSASRRRAACSCWRC